MLMEFGCYWIEYNVVYGYGDMLKFVGKDLYIFLFNLDYMYVGMSYIFLEFWFFFFWCECISEN